MKLIHRLLLLSLLSLAATAKTQTHDVFSNSYLSFGAGPNLYFSTSGTAFGGGGALTWGKWLLTTTGMRAQFSAHLAATKESQQMYYYGHFDVFFDLFTAIKGRNPSDRYRSYLVLGVGMVHNAEGDNDFCGVAGIGGDMRIGDNWRIFAELDALIHPSDFDNNLRSSVIGTLQLGVIRDIAFNPTRSRSRFETQGFNSDWFFQLSVGVNSFNYKGIQDFEERLDLLTPTFAFDVGKRLTSRWLIRFGLTGLYTKSSEEIFSFYNIRGDLIFDLMGLINPEKVNPLFDVQPYVSAGIVTRLDDQSHFLFSPAGGIRLMVQPDQRNEIFIDGRYLVTPPRFAHVETAQSTLSVGMATLMVGYGYKMGHQSFR